MNWGKVNSILIVAFLLINICLGIIISSGNAKSKYEVDGNRLKELQVNLDRYDIALLDFIPNYAPMQRLGIGRNDIDVDQIVQKTFEDGKYLIEEENESVVYTNGKKTLIFFSNKTIREEYIYKVNINDGEELISSDAGVKKHIDTIVQDIIGKKYGMKMVFFKQKEDKSYEIRYMGYYSEIPVFGSYINIKVSSNGDVVATVKLLEIKGLIREKHYLVEPEEMLYNIGERIKEDTIEQNFIMEIEIGYDAGIRIFEEVNQDYIEPYYRVQLVDGRVFYINGYTNEIVN